MAIVTDFSSDTGYGRTSPAKSVLPPITPLYDDNAAYNATFYPDKQVSAPSAAVQPVAYQAPIWESATQTYRDPASGLLAVGSDQTGWRWVTDAEYAAMQPVMAQPSRAPAPVMAPAPPPVVPTEDAYDLRGENITDADAYWQMYNPGGWEDVSARWYESDRGQVFNTPDFARLQDGTVLNIGPSTRTFYGSAGAEEKARERDLIYGDILRELGGQGLIEPLPERVTGLGDYYGYTAPVREYWNQKALGDIPYTEDALATFRDRPIGYLSSGIPAVRPSEFSTADISYGGFMGEDGFMALGTPFFSSGPYIHERGHDWQNLTMSWEESAPANVDFMNSIKIAMADPTLPDWLRYAIVSGEQHGHNTGSPLLEIYATIAQEVPGRLHELPPYLRRYFETLYTR